MTDHIKYFEKQIQDKLEQLPRAIKGEAPKEVLDKILQELDILKDAKEAFSLHDVSQKSELLPAFLERKDFDIIILKTEGTSVLKDWEEYLKAVNCY